MGVIRVVEGIVTPRVTRDISAIVYDIIENLVDIAASTDKAIVHHPGTGRNSANRVVLAAKSSINKSSSSSAARAIKKRKKRNEFTYTMLFINVIWIFTEFRGFRPLALGNCDRIHTS